MQRLVWIVLGFSYPPDDDWHYTSADYLTMGAAFADALANLERRCDPN